MFGWGGSFQYVECAACASLFIAEIPADVARYYPSDYYSFSAGGATSGLKQWVKKQVSLYRLELSAFPGNLLAKVVPDPMIVAWLRLLSPRLDMAVLDVGCGSGTYLNDMAGIGFTNLTGVDPFIAADTHTARGVPLYRKTVEDVQQTYDVVMSHHTFEHTTNPGAHLQALAARLNPGGQLLLRVPVAASEAWKRYGTDWFQLDAPRHIHIPSVAGLRTLAAQHRLRVDKIAFDADERQFWFSELYRQGKSLQQITDADKARFSSDQMQEFIRLTNMCNDNQSGDAACFVLRQIADGSHA